MLSMYKANKGVVVVVVRTGLMKWSARSVSVRTEQRTLLVVFKTPEVEGTCSFPSLIRRADRPGDSIGTEGNIFIAELNSSNFDNVKLFRALLAGKPWHRVALGWFISCGSYLLSPPPHNIRNKLNIEMKFTGTARRNTNENEM